MLCGDLRGILICTQLNTCRIRGEGDDKPPEAGFIVNADKMEILKFATRRDSNEGIAISVNGPRLMTYEHVLFLVFNLDSFLHGIYMWTMSMLIWFLHTLQFLTCSAPLICLDIWRFTVHSPTLTSHLPTLTYYSVTLWGMVPLKIVLSEHRNESSSCCSIRAAERYPVFIKHVIMNLPCIYKLLQFAHKNLISDIRHLDNYNYHKRVRNMLTLPARTNYHGITIYKRPPEAYEKLSSTGFESET
ncbi:hypothetical protein HHI36_023473 [Cryptolaemus montrouzieri]|uniref:Uncharacterized protein n=1 Tax=Cryptolaemus montrouzieri TaxID=559131 RepID=A0ABD2PIA3_9CUCU